MAAAESLLALGGTTEQGWALRALQDGEQHPCSLPTRCQEHNTHPPPPDCSNQVCPHTANGVQGPQLLLMENHWGCGSYLMVGLTVFTATSLLKKKKWKWKLLSPVGLFATLYSPWNSPGQNTGVGSLLQGIFPSQGSDPVSLALQEDSLLSEPAQDRFFTPWANSKAQIPVWCLYCTSLDNVSNFGPEYATFRFLSIVVGTIFDHF